MSKAIDASLLEGHGPWSEAAYDILDEMASRGNMIALFRKRELQRLASVLSQLPPTIMTGQPGAGHAQRGRLDPPTMDSGYFSHGNLLNTANQMGTATMDYQPFDNNFWQDEMGAEQLMLIADSLELDGLDWMTASLEDSSAQSQIL